MPVLYEDYKDEKEIFIHLLPLSLFTGFARIRKETSHTSWLTVLVQPYRSTGG